MFFIPGIHLVKRSTIVTGVILSVEPNKEEAWAGSDHAYHTSSPRPPSYFCRLLLLQCLITIALCFTNWMPGTGYLSTFRNDKKELSSCNVIRKMMRRKKNTNWWYGFVKKLTPNSQNLESKKCMADRAENLQLYLGRRGRGRSLMLYKTAGVLNKNSLKNCQSSKYCLYVEKVITKFWNIHGENILSGLILVPV